jgi:hypothetical protein
VNSNPDTYDVYVRCTNCGTSDEPSRFWIDIPKGHPVNTHTCPRCGCVTLKNACLEEAQ